MPGWYLGLLQSYSDTCSSSATAAHAVTRWLTVLALVAVQPGATWALSGSHELLNGFCPRLGLCAVRPNIRRKKSGVMQLELKPCAHGLYHKDMRVC